MLRVLALLALAGLAGCDRGAPRSSDEPAPSSATTRSGGLTFRNWSVDPPVQTPSDVGPQRIVSAAPSVTETLFALGLSERVVGRTRYCTHPPAVAEIPSIGALVDLNTERLRALRPDLVLVAGQSRLISERLDHADMRYASAPDVTLDDLFTMFDMFGEVAGARAAADVLARGVRDELDRVTARFTGAPSRRVLLLIGVLSDPPTPPFVAGPGSFYDDLLRRAGHRNAVQVGLFGAISFEAIHAADPDVIIELDPDGAARPKGAADALRVWRQLPRIRAVSEGRVHVLTGGQHYLLGPRIAQTYAALCAAITSDDNRGDEVEPSGDE